MLKTNCRRRWADPAVAHCSIHIAHKPKNLFLRRKT